MSTLVFPKFLSCILFVTIFAFNPSLKANETLIYTVFDMVMDETAESAAAAREIALKKGQLLAFRRVLNRVVPIPQQSLMPDPTPAMLLDLVTGIEIKDEKTSTVRYLANLTVRFNQRAMRALMRKTGISFAETRGGPLLVLPVFQVAGTIQLWDAANTWLKSWQTAQAEDTLLQLVVPLGDGLDIATISPQQALEGDVSQFVKMMKRYRAKGAVLAVAELGTDMANGSSVVQLVLTRFIGGRRGTTTVFSFSANPNSKPETLLATARQKARDELVEGWKQNNLIRFGEKHQMLVSVPLLGLAEWIEIRRRLSSIGLIESVELRSISLGEATLQIGHYGGQKQLALALTQHDMDLRQGSVDWELNINITRTENLGGASTPP